MSPRRRGYDEMENLWCGLALALSVVATSSVSLYAQPSFYQGKTISVIVSSDAGGTVDMRVKALAPVLRKYIPGNPVIVTEYMPGGAQSCQPSLQSDPPRRSNDRQHEHHLSCGCGPGRVGGAVQYRQIHLLGSARWLYPARFYDAKRTWLVDTGETKDNIRY